MNNRRTYRNILAIILLTVYVLNPFKLFLPYLNYSINQQYISATLCENKDIPAMNCQGKCYLKKELEKAKEESSQQKTTFQNTLSEENISRYSFELACPFITFSFDFPFYSDVLLSSENNYTSPPPRV